MAIDLAARRKAAADARKAAEAKLTPEVMAEKAERDALAADEAAARDADRTLRDLDLARRMDLAREALGPDARIESLTIDKYPDTFIVQGDQKAHAKWDRAVSARAGGNTKIDLAEEQRKYAIALVYDWNGKTGDTTSTYDLQKYLEANAGLVTPITNLGARLNGVFAEARKSGD